MEQTNANVPCDFIMQRVTFHIGSISSSLIHKVSCHFQAFIISIWLINAACLRMAAECVLSVVAWICLALSVWMDCKPGFSPCWLHTAELDLSHRSHNSGKTLLEIWAVIAQGTGFLILNEEMWEGLTANCHLNNGDSNPKRPEQNKWGKYMKKADGGGGKKHLLLPRLQVSRDGVMSGRHIAVLWINTSFACGLGGMLVVSHQWPHILDTCDVSDWPNAIEIHLETD